MKKDKELDQLFLGLGIVVSELRKKQMLSQEEFAQLCTLHRTYISDIENGKRNVTVAVLYLIGKALGLSTSKLLELAEDADTNASRV